MLDLTRLDRSPPRRPGARARAASPGSAVFPGSPGGTDLLSGSDLAEQLFDLVPDTVFFVKDLKGRYLAVNQSLVERCGKRFKEEMLGKTAAELFPPGLGIGFSEQDRQVLASGEPIHGVLELHLYPNHHRGWCLTSKIPLWKDGRVAGLAGISRDLGAPDEQRAIPASLACSVEHIRSHYDRELSIGELAAIAQLPPSRFVRLIKRIFQVTPGQLVIKIRMQAAIAQLRESDASIAEIALSCGFCDQSAFTRRFKAVTGLTPLRYRAWAFPEGRAAPARSALLG